MVSRYSTRKQEAMEFPASVQREDMQKAIFEIGGYFPTTRVYSDTAYVNQHPDLALL